MRDVNEQFVRRFFVFFVCLSVLQSVKLGVCGGHAGVAVNALESQHAKDGGGHVAKGLQGTAAVGDGKNDGLQVVHGAVAVSLEGSAHALQGKDLAIEQLKVAVGC